MGVHTGLVTNAASGCGVRGCVRLARQLKMTQAMAM